MGDGQPKPVTIGVPVFNGAELLGESLACLRRDPYAAFRVIILDNASTDATPLIAKQVIDEDSRFSYVRHPTNIGAISNFLSAVERCETEYFLWRAHDDLSNPSFLTELVALLDANPDSVLATPCTITSRIGRARRKYRPFHGSQKPRGIGRSTELLSRSQAGWLYGVFRTEFVKTATRKVHERYDHVLGWDHLVLFQTILHGGVVGSNKAVFHHRMNDFGVPHTEKMGRRDRWEFAQAYYQFCAELLEEANYSRSDRWRLKIGVLRHINRRVVRWTRFF